MATRPRRCSMTEDSHQTADILIIGGGLSGTMLAAQLLRRPGQRRILIIETRSELGRGEAYSATEPGHTLNGNAARMSVDPDNPDDLTQWLTDYLAAGGWPEAYEQRVPVAELFPPRGVFGLYVQQRLREALSAAEAFGSTAVHVPGEAVDLQVHEGGVSVSLADGRKLRGSRAVLATGMYAASRTPRRDSNELNTAALDPWDVAVMKKLDPQSKVLIIGSGLTMVDALVSLDTVRANIGRLWNQASDRQRRQFVHHVRPWWESHHHRSPPPSAALLAQLIRQGRLSIDAASLQAVASLPSGQVQISVRRRGDSEPTQIVGDALINSTGIEYDWRRVDRPLPRQLLLRGLIQPGPLALGIAADAGGAVLDAQGHCSSRLFAMGPPLRGMWWESTAVTDVAIQAKALAMRLS
ncbi:Pyridine nucleotide-disulfide family oxidoreductase [Pseudomonas savastanoi]|uniref:Pyridine nucleotide-disulfide family oxidoreductase n=2 Tax=Pseudomonas savastanoi TaxID=29438 RepID=A0A3M6A9G7_PSESS|nr:Pyridine nucleotide-disulfide family oxidoreductase [Pseudomonas savastanoi]